MLWGAYTSEWDDVWLCLLIVRGGCLLTRLYRYFKAELKPCCLIFNMNKSDFCSDCWFCPTNSQKPFIYHHKLQRKAANLYIKEAGTSKCERFCLKINRTIS